MKDSFDKSTPLDDTDRNLDSGNGALVRVAQKQLLRWYGFGSSLNPFVG